MGYAAVWQLGALVTLGEGGFGWRLIYVLSAVFALAIAAAAYRLSPETPRNPDATLDLPGAACLFAALRGRGTARAAPASGW